MTKRNLRSKESNLGDDAEKLYQNKIRDLESVNQALKRDVEELRSKLADVSINSSAGSKAFSHKSSATRDKPTSSRSKSKFRSISSAKKHNTDSQVKQSDGEVQRLKAQKVKLQCKIKLDSMHFRLLKASLEKEIFQAKKELRKCEFEKHVLSALNRRQKLILQLKNTQALTALKRLQLLPQSKRISSNKNNGQLGPLKGTCSKVQESSNEVGLVMKLNKIHSSYERQMKEMAEEVKKFGLEADMLKAEFEGEQNFCSAASSDIRINRSPMDSELMELKEEFNKLSTMVSQLEMTKSQLSEINNVQGEPKYSVSSKNTNDQSNLELSQPKAYKKTLCSTDGQANLELSQPKTPEETLCNTNDQSNLEPSQTKNSERMMLCDTNDLSKLEPSQPEISEEALCKKQESKAEMCCSCTKKSLCKTKSCKCRANGSGCGSSCGCLASKCSNREDNVKSDKAMQPVTSKKPAGVSRDGKEANKQPLRDIGNIQEAAKVGKLKKVQKRVAKK